MRTLIFTIAMLCCAAAGIPAGARADIYQWIDEEGVRHFTNTPNSPKYRLYSREPRSGAPAMLHNINRYDDLITRAAEYHGLSFALIKSVIRAESGFNPRAVSRKGAKGLMQIMPDNFRRLRLGDPFDPWQNISAGARYLKWMLKRFDGDLPLALAAYNAGPLAVERYRTIPPYRETQRYVRRVLAFYDDLQRQGVN